MSSDRRTNRRLQAHPNFGSPIAAVPETMAYIAGELARMPRDVGVEALTAAHDTWLQGTRNVTVQNGVATIPVRGVLTKHWSYWNYYTSSSSYEDIALDLEECLANSEVRSIILSINSPGGQVDGVQELAARIRKALSTQSKPIDAHVDGAAASAAFWIACAARRVYVSPTALLGNVGTVWSFLDWSGYEENLGIRTIEIVSTQSPNKRPDPTTEEGRAILSAHVDAMAAVFIADVATYRPQAKIAELAGDVRVGALAIDAGLADELLQFDELQDRLFSENVLPVRLDSALQSIQALAPSHPAAVAARAHAAVESATHSPEVSMHTNRAARPAATADAAEEEEEEVTPPADNAASGEEDEEEAPEAEGHEEPEEEEEPAAEGEDEEEDPEAKALAKQHAATVARIRTRAAKAERTRISSIRALGRPGLERVIQACVDDPSCTVAGAALQIVRHDQSRRQEHLAGVRRDEQALDAPPNHPTADAASGTTAQVQSITATYLNHKKSQRAVGARRN